MMCISVLAGCSLWERNDKSYYEATVATITYQDGSKDKITKRELITAFNSYGYNYVQNYGMGMEAAVNQTLESIIEKYLTIKDVKDTAAARGEELFNDREKSYLWDLTYDTVYSNLKTYLEGYKDDNGDGSSSATTNSSVFVDYKSSIDSLEKDANGNWVIRKKTSETKVKDTYTIHKDANGAFDFEYYDKSSKKYPYQELMFNNIYAMTEVGSWKAAYNKYVETIKDSYSYKKLSGDEWFKFEINRVYEILRDNYIVEKFEDMHLTANQGLSTTTGYDILKAYTKRVNVDYTSYVSRGNISSFESSVLSSISNVDYIVTEKDNPNVGRYFYLAPIKINVEGLSALKSQRDNQEITPEKYKTEVEKLFNRNNLTVSVRNEKTGEVESKISVNALYNEIESTLSAKANQKTKLNEQVDQLTKEISAKYEELAGCVDDEYWRDRVDESKQDEEKEKLIAEKQAEIDLLETELKETNDEIYALGLSMAEAYRKYFYLYNDDDSNKGADYNAVFGVDANGNAITPDGYKDDAIKAAIEELYSDGKAQVGDFSKVVQAEDGFYIFFFAGNVVNPFDMIDVDFDATTNRDNILVLAKTRINVFSSKTLLDIMFDQLDSNNFSVFQTMDMNGLRYKAKSITRHKENIKDLYK